MHSSPQRCVAQRDAIAIIVGRVIGAGIVKTPSVVVGIAGDAGWILVTWLAGPWALLVMRFKARLSIKT